MRIAAALLVVLVLLGTFGYFWLRSVARAALPQLDGTRAVQGLQAPVQVVRDKEGVPHITASSLEDLFFAQGYVTAQDRLWQMDASRRFAAGELAEILGSSMVAQDMDQRILGLRQVAERSAAALSPRDRAYFEAYARGVNAYIDSHRGRLPLEFRILGYTPRPWKVEDSFLVGAMMSELLNNMYRDELHREKILAKIGPQLTADLYVNTSLHEVPPGSDALDFESTEPQQVEPPDTDPRHAVNVSSLTKQEMQRERLVPGSNNWVISGAHTVSGRPLLCNDMHLPLQIPNTWYETQLTAGDYDVAGVTLPGAPFVIVGHNRRIAWGFTNLGPDVEDIFVEKFNAKGQYLTPTGWKEPEHRQEVIAVKGGDPVKLDVVVTRHGPIVTPLIKGEKRELALEWTLYSPSGMTFPFFDVNSAQNWKDLRAAFSKFSSPGQNVVYADLDGNIGYQATGLVPIRASGDGSLPVNGSDDKHEWIGYIPFDKMPSVYNPPSGIIATANSRITPDRYPYTIATEWAAPYRVERIYSVLHEDKKFSPEDMLALQTDVYSELDYILAQRIAFATEHTPGASERVKTAGDILRDWDGRFERDSAGAAICYKARYILTRMLLRDKLGHEARDYTWMMSSVWLENTIRFGPRRWLPRGYKDYNQLLVAAVTQAVEDGPKDLSSWQYGDIFKVDISHPVLSRIPTLGHLASTGPLPQSGSGNTVKQVGRSFGPSERMTVDFSNFDNSTLNIVNGQSGNLLSPYFNDQWNAWYNGTTFQFPFSAAAVQKDKAHTLTLIPVKVK